ncbi:AT-hook motif nuclear-localized protein 28-like [Vicia villosa]|uniref:AT-hook motif nuclear-localized protein 28-like n=1 Tax=Vicia villosa TaxID=3911 RepID=UPI00273B3605|nr:AT-hook motif nuclear-localized protein 28-like [Vicia villosa]
MENSIANMENIFLEIPIGNDVVEAIIDFAKSREASIVVMKGSGLVSDITLLQSDSRIPTYKLDGPFNVLSLAGVYLNPNCCRVPDHLIYDPLCTAFALQLSGSRAQVFGGVIGGKIIAASDIQISASLFKRPDFLRLVTTNGNVQVFEDDDVPTIVGDVDAGDGGVDGSESES